MFIIEITPFEKGVISNSLPKTFSFIFSHIGLALYYYRAFFYFRRALYEKKSAKKVFGKGYGGDSPQCGEMSAGQRGAPPSEEPFFRKVSPIINYKLLYKYHGYTVAFACVIGQQGLWEGLWSRRD